ncbi:30S ribosomal protein S19e [Candidatus Woesearchaeota archaeon CG10_big_fil_rev_8_21_14_0_10_37_12]|nr:MAG: 30S ribosomal protein S19e [Candidatus Woesearchaeota archaeon CG10_big_fil_rev_8_21_14_0_10_37_12]
MAIRNVNPTKLVHRTAKELGSDKSLAPPSWAAFAKTSAGRERVPMQENWWHIRSAAILRKISVMGPIGTIKLKKKFGGTKNKGYTPDQWKPGSGAIVRKILQQLEKAGFAKQTAKGVHKGRIITPKGQKLLDKVATEIMKEENVVIPAKPKGVVLKVDKPKKAVKKKSPVKRKTTKKAAVAEETAAE